MNGFHEVLFPRDISLGARGGPERRTDIVALGSGREVRNARWARSRRKWQAGFGVKSYADLANILNFFEERRGRLFGFRWRDKLDWSSASYGAAISCHDQKIGVGDGQNNKFQLIKTYGGAYAPYPRQIVKPIDGSTRVAVNGVELNSNAFVLDITTGIVTLAQAPSVNATISAGFKFDTPVRFDADFLDIDHSRFEAGEIPEIPIIEIFL